MRFYHSEISAAEAYLEMKREKDDDDHEHDDDHDDDYDKSHERGKRSVLVDVGEWRSMRQAILRKVITSLIRESAAVVTLSPRQRSIGRCMTH